MSNIDNYGEFDLPEETAKIEVVENPVKTILSCYELFEIQTNSLEKDLDRYHNNELVNKISNIAKKLFEGKQKLDATKEELIEVNELCQNRIERLNDERATKIGLFLTALINETKISFLPVKIHNTRYLGYKLKKEKTIEIHHKSNVDRMGEYAEGNTINYGEATHQAEYAKGGIHLNLNIFHNQGWCANKGIFINWGKSAMQGNHARGGIYINLGILDHQGDSSNGSGLYLNKGIIKGSQAGHAIKGVHINQGVIYQTQNMWIQGATCINIGQIHWQGKWMSGKENIPYKTVKDKYAKNINLSERKQLKNELEQKLLELDFLEEPKGRDSVWVIKEISAFNWEKYEQEMNELAEKIKRECERK